jgi:hypothetical protein
MVQEGGEQYLNGQGVIQNQQCEEEILDRRY